MADKNFQIKNGLSINDQQVIDSSRNANLTSALISGIDILSYAQAAFNQANTGGGGSGLDQYARDTANGANGLAQGAYNTSNTNTTNITAVNQFASGAYNTANGANGLAQGAYNTANTNTTNISILQGVDLWQNTQITSVNQFAQAAYNQANTGGGGGSSSSNAFITVQDSTNYRNLGTPDLVEFIPSSNLIVKGPITMGSSNSSTSLSNLGNTYVDFGAISSNWQSFDKYYPQKEKTFGQAVWIAKTGGLPTSVFNALTRLVPGDKIRVTFAAGTSSNALDQFIVDLELTTPAYDTWSYWYQLPFNEWRNSQPSGGPDRPLSDTSWYQDIGGQGLTFFTKNIVVQPTYNSTSNTTTTTLTGISTGLALNSTFINNWYGRGILSLINIFTTNASGSAASQRVGVVSISIPQRNGTVIKFSPTVYDDILFYKDSLYSSNGIIKFSNPVFSYNAANYQIVMSSSNLVSQVSTSTQIQTYDALRSETPTLKLGENLSAWEDPYTKKFIVDGDIYRTYGYNNLGKILSTGTTQGVTNTSSYISGMYSSYTRRRMASTNLPKNSLYLNSQAGSATTNGNFWLLNVDDTVFEALKANGSTCYITYISANTTPINVSFRTTANSSNGVLTGSNQLYNYNFGYFGVQNNWIKMSLTRYVIGNTNTSFGAFGSFNYDPQYGDAVLYYPTNVITITTDSTTINNVISNTSPLYIGNVTINVASVNTSTNTIVTFLPEKPYANVILAGAPITTYKQSSKLATISDIQDNLPFWVKSITAQLGYGQSVNSGANFFKMSDQTGLGTWIPYIGTTTLNDIGSSGGYNVSGDFTFNGTTDSRWASKGAGYYQQGAIYTQGGIGVNKGVWIGTGLWANTSVSSPAGIFTLLTAANTVVGNTSSDYITVPQKFSAYGDPFYANTVLLLLGNYSGGVIKDDSAANATITMQGSAGALSTSADVPTGATGVSVILPPSTWFSFNNPNSKSWGNSDWTIETWVKTDWFYWGYRFFQMSNDNGYIEAQWPYYPYVYMNGTAVMTGPYTEAVYNAFTNPANEWNHWAWQRSGDNLYLHINGVRVATATGANSYSYDTSALTFKVGPPNGFSVNNTRFYNFRATIGNARYGASNFSTTSAQMLAPYGTVTNNTVIPPNAGSVDLYGGIQFHNLNSITSNTALQIAGGGYLYTANNRLYYTGPNTTTLLANS